MNFYPRQPSSTACFLSIACLLCLFLTSSEWDVEDDSSTLQVDITERQSTNTTATPTPQYLIGRHFHISNKGLMTTIMHREKPFTESLGYILRYVEYIEQSTVRFLKEHKGPLHNQTFMPCNTEGTGSKKAYSNYLPIRGLPAADVSCITEFVGEQTFPDEPSQFSARRLDTAIRISQAQLFANRHPIVNVLMENASKWTPDVGRLFKYNTTSARCIVNNIAGTRLRDKWYILETITNAPISFNLPLFGRQIMTEAMHVNRDGVLERPLEFKMNKRPPDGDSSAHVLQNDTTTMLISIRGATGPNAFTKMYQDDIPAYRRALDMSSLSIQQVEDALTPSSLVIFVLPLVLNLVPLALLVDVTSPFLFGYTLMSDVVTVVPLAIKGFELILIGKTRNMASAIRMTGSQNGVLSETALMEMWTAECRARDNVLPTGIIFLILATSFIVLGVVLEFVAKSYIKARRLRHKLFDVEHEQMAGLPGPQGQITDGGAIEGVGLMRPLSVGASDYVQALPIGASNHMVDNKDRNDYEVPGD